MKAMVNKVSTLKWTIGKEESRTRDSSEAERNYSLSIRQDEKYVPYVGNGPRIILLGRYVLIDHIDDVFGGS